LIDFISWWFSFYLQLQHTGNKQVSGLRQSLALRPLVHAAKSVNKTDKVVLLWVQIVGANEGGDDCRICDRGDLAFTETHSKPFAQRPGVRPDNYGFATGGWQMAYQ